MNFQFPSFQFPYDVILSHKSCNDGATAAWIVWRTLPESYRQELEKEGGFYATPKFEEEQPKTKKKSQKVLEKMTLAEFKLYYDSVNKPYVHPNSFEGAMDLQSKGYPVVFAFADPKESIPTALIYNKRVLILDLDLGIELIKIVKVAKHVVLIEHHDSTATAIKNNAEYLLTENKDKFVQIVNTDKSESAATLTWKYFWKSEDNKVPDLIEIVRIGDHHKWEDCLELHPKLVHNALFVERVFRSFIDIERTFINWEENFEHYVEKGRNLAEYQKALVNKAAKHCDLGYIRTCGTGGSIKMYTVAYTQATILHSEIGANIRKYAEKRFNVPIDFCVTWKYASHKDAVSLSFRDPQKGINLAEIAATMKNENRNGGGHETASSFTFFGIHNLHKFIRREKG